VILSRRLVVAINRRTSAVRALRVSFALLLVVVSSLVVQKAASAASAVQPGDASRSPSAPVEPVAQPRIAPDTVRPQVVDGQGLRFKRISTADGLSQTRVAQIVQDAEGFMWFGTQYGLNRYDGYDFKLFVHDPLRPESLAGVFVTALFKDHLGVLWVGCNQILDRFDPVTETFTHYVVDSSNPDALGATVVHISEDRSGMLWLATGTGLHRLDPQTGKLLHYRFDPKDRAGLRTNDVNWSGEDKSGNFWIGTSEGLDQFDRATGKITFHVPIADGVQISFFEDRLGKFWITHACGNGLALLDRKENTLTRYAFYDRDSPPTALTGVMGILEDKDGALWLGSPGIGLLEFDRDHERFIHYANHPGDTESIAEDKVIALYADHDGNIWTGLHSKGPNHFSTVLQPFQRFKHEPGNPDSLNVDFVNALYEDHEGSLWIGNDNGLNRIDRKTGARTSWTGGLGDKPMVITITEDNWRVIWFGTFGNGLNSFDPASGVFKSYRHDPADPTSLSNDEVHRVFIDRTGTLWAGTDDGLNRFDRSTGRFQVYKLDAHNRRSQSYVAIAEDQSGILWLGTHYSGLHRFEPTSGKLEVFKAYSQSALRDNMIPWVHIARTGSIWVGTQNGLNQLDVASGAATAYDRRDGLPGNTISCILEDTVGGIWMSTNKGISRFDPVKRAFSNYSELDGLPGNDLTGWSACYRSPVTGELFFGGFPGAVAFVPEQLRPSSGSPAIVLTDLQLAGASVPIGSGSLLERAIAHTSRLTLAHEQSIFSVAFSALSYRSPETVRYRYKLDGLEREWQETSSERRQAGYTTLPAGTYTLHVQAAFCRGSWTEPGVSLQVTVLPPWWSAWWFRAAYSALFLLLIWWAYRLRVQQISRELTLRMEERIGERTRIAQDLHDTLLQGMLSASLQLAVAHRDLPSDVSARPLVGRVLELMRQTIDEGRNAVRGLRSKKTDDLEAAFAQIRHDLDVDDQVDFRLIVEGTPRDLQPLIRDEVYSIGREALANAFRHSQAASVEIVLRYTRAAFGLLVWDNGSGIDGDVAQSGRDGHWGLSGMRERSQRIGARLKVASRAGAGTEVELLVPASVAFARSAETGAKQWLSRLWQKKWGR
jgi:ligand-binding sensor domain-containing protein/signal transduction histidine kinase